MFILIWYKKHHYTNVQKTFGKHSFISIKYEHLVKTSWAWISQEQMGKFQPRVLHQMNSHESSVWREKVSCVGRAVSEMWGLFWDCQSGTRWDTQRWVIMQWCAGGTCRRLLWPHHSLWSLVVWEHTSDEAMCVTLCHCLQTPHIKMCGKEQYFSPMRASHMYTMTVKRGAMFTMFTISTC